MRERGYKIPDRHLVLAWMVEYAVVVVVVVLNRCEVSRTPHMSERERRDRRRSGATRFRTSAQYYHGS